MQEFIFLFRGGKTENASQNSLERHEEAWDEWMDSLDADGVLIDGLPMEDHGVMVTGDGMQDVEAGGEGVTGYLIIECRDLDHATELASDCPIFEFGGMVEVRTLINDRG